RDGVLQDDGGTIVKRRVVVAKTVHYTIERSQDRRANLHEYVEANMHRAPLGSVITCEPILVTRVNRARFVVPADAYAAARSPHAIKEQARELLDIGQLCHIAQFAAANAQVEDDLAGGTQVWFDHAPQFVSVVFKPANDGLRVRAGRQVTDCAGMHHVTEINYATDLSSFFACCTGCADQHIVIVGIAVNDARAQRGQDGQHLRFKARE